MELENSAGFNRSSGEADIRFRRTRVTCYAARGIRGAMPHPVICRIERDVTWSKLIPMRHKRVLVFPLNSRVFELPFNSTPRRDHFGL